MSRHCPFLTSREGFRFRDGQVRVRLKAGLLRKEEFLVVTDRGVVSPEYNEARRAKGLLPKVSVGELDGVVSAVAVYDGFEFPVTVDSAAAVGRRGRRHTRDVGVGGLLDYVARVRKKRGVLAAAAFVDCQLRNLPEGSSDKRYVISLSRSLGASLGVLARDADSGAVPPERFADILGVRVADPLVRRARDVAFLDGFPGAVSLLDERHVVDAFPLSSRFGPVVDVFAERTYVRPLTGFTVSHLPLVREINGVKVDVAALEFDDVPLLPEYFSGLCLPSDPGGRPVVPWEEALALGDAISVAGLRPFRRYWTPDAYQKRVAVSEARPHYDEISAIIDGVKRLTGRHYEIKTDPMAVALMDNLMRVTAARAGWVGEPGFKKMVKGMSWGQQSEFAKQHFEEARRLLAKAGALIDARPSNFSVVQAREHVMREVLRGPYESWRSVRAGTFQNALMVAAPSGELVDVANTEYRQLPASLKFKERSRHALAAFDAVRQSVSPPAWAPENLLESQGALSREAPVLQAGIVGDVGFVDDLARAVAQATAP